MRVIPKQPVSIVMPVCNEADIIEDVVEEWVNEVLQYLPEGSELFFDEAASTDGTREILKRLQVKHPFIRLNFNPVKEGFAVAAKRLYREARCPLIFFTDSDGQYVPAEFWKLTPYIDDFDIVHGAKIGRQDPIYRKVASGVFNLIARFIFGIHYADINSAFRIVKKEVRDAILPNLGAMPTLLNAEFLVRAAYKNYLIKEISVVHRKRKHGVSRGLPPSQFLKECIRAFKAMLSLKNEHKFKSNNRMER